MTSNSKFTLKKQPVQSRSQFLVESIKEAATRVLKEQGVAGFTTNYVADIAGVSIGSLYQYFGSKEVLIAELKRDHFQQLRELFASAEAQLQTDDICEMIDAFIDASVTGHMLDPELHRILSQDFGDFEVKEKDQSEDSIMVKVEAVLHRYRHQLRDNLSISAASHLVYTLVESSVHDIVLNVKDEQRQLELITELKRLVGIYLVGEGKTY